MSKIQFFTFFYSVALQEILDYGLSCSVAEWLEISFDHYVKWHKSIDWSIHLETKDPYHLLYLFERYMNAF